MEAENLKVNQVIEKHHREKKELIAILQDIQAEYDYLPQESLKLVAKSLGIPLTDIIGVATFYRAFSLKSRGKHLITVCLGTACHVRGAPTILDEFKRKLNIQVGETTKDNLFTLETVNCLGACALGPIAVVDNNYFGQMKIRMVDKLIKKFSPDKRSKSE